MSADANCPNCDAILHARYCSRCGQDSHETDLRLSSWVRGAVDEIAGVNGRLPLTLKMLFTQPGFLAAEWSQGRRERYLRPLRLYLVSAVIFFSLGWIAPARDGMLTDLVAGFSVGIETTDQERWQQFREQLDRTLPNVVIVLVPLAAVVLKMLFGFSRRYFAEHLVFALHFHSVLFLLRAVEYAIPRAAQDPVSLLVMLLVIVYVIVAARNFYQLAWTRALLRGGVFLLLYGLVVVTVTLLAGGVFVMLRA